MRCHFFDALRATLMNDLMNIDNDLPTSSDENLTNIVLYGNQIYDKKTNQITLMHVIRYIKDSQRFDELFLARLKLLLTSNRFGSVSLF